MKLYTNCRTKLVLTLSSSSFSMCGPIKMTLLNIKHKQNPRMVVTIHVANADNA